MFFYIFYILKSHFNISNNNSFRFLQKKKQRIIYFFLFNIITMVQCLIHLNVLKFIDMHIPISPAIILILYKEYKLTDFFLTFFFCFFYFIPALSNLKLLWEIAFIA